MDWTLDANGEKREALPITKYDKLCELFGAYLIIRLFHSCETILVRAMKERYTLAMRAILAHCPF